MMSRWRIFGILCLQVCLSLASAQCQDKECAVCSVVVDHVINFDTAAAKLSSCSYSLLHSAPIPQLQVQVVLKPRRNLNVNFVNEVKVIYGETTVNLRGGHALTSGGDIGAQLISGRAVEVTSGLTVSRDESFTTIDLQQGEHSLRLKYNGVSTHLRLTGPKGQALAVDGLCKSNTAPADFQTDCDPEYKDSQEPQYEAQVDALCSSLDSLSSALATRMKAVCRSVLTFTGDSDQLPCALALAFNAHAALADEDTAALLQLQCNLEVLQSCVTRLCGSSEFCGEKGAGSKESDCFCHASVSASYSDSGQIGALQCTVTDATLSIPSCYLKERGIDHAQLHLQDDGCKGALDPDTRLLVFRTNKDEMCGAMLKSADGGMQFANAVLLGEEEVAEMSCPFAIPEISVDFDVSVTVLDDPDSPGSVEFSTTGLGSYSVQMRAFLDSAHRLPVDAHMKLRLNTPVYFQIRVQGLDHLKPALVLDSCWATNQRDPDQEPKYFLIQNRCPADQWVALVRSGVDTEAELLFRVFQFVGHTSDIFLHCLMKLCLPQEGACEPECGESSRRRRSSAPRFIASFGVNALNWK